MDATSPFVEPAAPPAAPTEKPVFRLLAPEEITKLRELIADKAELIHYIISLIDAYYQFFTNNSKMTHSFNKLNDSLLEGMYKISYNEFRAIVKEIDSQFQKFYKRESSFFNSLLYEDSYDDSDDDTDDDTDLTP